MKKESCRAIINSAAFLLKIFLASAGRVAVTEGGDLGGLGVIPQQAFWPVQSGQNRKTCICLHCLPICANLFRKTIIKFLLTKKIRTAILITSLLVTLLSG